MENTTTKLIAFSGKVKPDVKDFIYKKASDLGLTIGEALEFIIADATKPAPEPVIEKVFSDDDLILFNRSLPADVDESLPINEKVKIFVDTFWQLNSEVLELEKRIITLSEKEPEKIEIEVIKEVPIQLEPNQFIASLPEAQQLKLRKCRKFMIDDGRVPKGSQVNDMLPLFIDFYLDTKYDHILNPIFR